MHKIENLLVNNAAIKFMTPLLKMKQTRKMKTLSLKTGKQKFKLHLRTST